MASSTRGALIRSAQSIDIESMGKIVKSYLKCRILEKSCGANHLYVGPPGIGKSETVVEAAKGAAEEAGLKFWEYENSAEPEDYNKAFVMVLFRLDMVKPEDLSGFPLPDKNDKSFDYAIPRWAKVLRKAKAGLVILDEFTNINDDTVLSAAYDIVLSEKVNLYYFRKPVIALGNPPEYSSIARPLPLPLLNRLAVFNVKEPSVDMWCNYMQKRYNDSWAKEVCAFLKSFRDYLIKLPEETELLEPYPTPRSWSSLALALYNAYPDLYDALRSGNKELRKELTTLVSAYVGPEAAHAFVSWAFSKSISVEELIEKPDLVLQLSEDQAALVLQALAHYSHPHWKSRTTKVVKRLLEEPGGTRYVAMLLRFMEPSRRNEFIDYLKSKNKMLLYEIKKKIGGKELFED
ncbi:hypothetical protein [Ignicoccus hospitalis]|uniref:ATPase associated with various cellular activities, AAA_5 n=1 Tax=Ignicoccus hospitalis (strain KIN4/I / DSM 18386 / JCM 14125) TaxID=453591 RepID=A8A8G6_IGNH4|nr:hypothetical protein [Ignicoccus hospitalis]ABU81218.1 hypothetical protein Igni_0034 [Ignicoccus hospitalis KIN4/I]HIH90648.1 hypothetical protein [Desulfurococcaceae archaeon]